MQKYFSFLIVLLVVFAVGISWYGWDNTQLRLSRISGYFSLTNNPLLRHYDKDYQFKRLQWRISRNQLIAGGPAKDGIPAIDKPIFVKAHQSVFADDAIVVGVYHQGIAKAYPYGILNWHEIVNDNIANLPITVTLCPFCDTNPVFIRKIANRVTTFGVSGKLYQSCLVMYDRHTESLWSQPWGIAVAGKHTNFELQRIPSFKTTLGRWKKRYPNTLVLSTDTGHQRNYQHYPYGTYNTDNSMVFPVKNLKQLRVPSKTIISYIWRHDDARPFDRFSGHVFSVTHERMRRVRRLRFIFNGQSVTAQWDPQLQTVRFFSSEGEIASSSAFAFVYPAFFSVESE